MLELDDSGKIYFDTFDLQNEQNNIEQLLAMAWSLSGNLKICMDHELGLVAYEYLFNKTDDLKESFHVNPNILEADRIT